MSSKRFRLDLIEIEIAVEKNFIRKIVSEGHAPKYIENCTKDEDGNDQKPSEIFNGLCTAISTLEYQFYYSVKKILPHMNTNCDIKEGTFHWEENSSSNLGEADRIKFSTLSEAFIVGVTMIERRHPEITVKIR